MHRPSFAFAVPFCVIPWYQNTINVNQQYRIINWTQRSTFVEDQNPLISCRDPRTIYGSPIANHTRGFIQITRHMPSFICSNISLARFWVYLFPVSARTIRFEYPFSVRGWYKEGVTVYKFIFEEETKQNAFLKAENINKLHSERKRIRSSNNTYVLPDVRAKQEWINGTCLACNQESTIRVKIENLQSTFPTNCLAPDRRSSLENSANVAVYPYAINRSN